jgi:glyoxylase-like metal-dependent hydrolase (beta-lactamase superfamily II)
MIQIKEVVNNIFTSKTYILYRKGESKAWLVDIGDIEPVIAVCKENGLTIEGVFLTHGHFDHIYGLKLLMEHFPQCGVYATEYCKRALMSDKMNLSKYHDNSFSYEGENVDVVHEGESMTLFEDEPLMSFYETPGHNPGCLTMVLGDLIFTGDAYIPEVGTNTQLPHADKELAKRSQQRIIKLAEGKRILSGHQVG